MANSILYGVVVKFEDGGEQMNSFSNKESAIDEANKLVNILSKGGKYGIKVYLSELEYDRYKNTIVSSHLINDNSIQIYPI